MFFETYGGKYFTLDHGERVLSASMQERRRAQKRRKTTRTQLWTKSREDNIQKNHCEPHDENSSEHLVLLRKQQTDPKYLRMIFEKARMEAFSRGGWIMRDVLESSLMTKNIWSCYLSNNM